MGLRNNITRQYLKDTIGEENIFTHYFGEFSLGSNYHSCFRDDNKKSTGFYISESGSIIYNDLRTGEKYDFVHFVMKLHECNYHLALKQIATDFGLIKGGNGNVSPIALNASNSPKKQLKKAFIINTCAFKKQHLDYWAEYGITPEELKNNNIYAVDSFIINKFDADGVLVNTYSCPPNNEIKFVYTFTKGEETYVKIYTPHSKQFRWFGDVPLAVPFGLDDISYNKDEDLIITKSVKDTLVLRKYFKNVIGLQNESAFSIDEQTLSNLIDAHKEVIIWFDNDPAGIDAAKYYADKYGFKTYTTPNKEQKDPSDFVKKYGLAVFKQYLQYIKLI